MKSLVIRLLVVLVCLFPGVLYAHTITLTGTSHFSALDGSADDHDGVVNGVFTVDDGDLIVNGVVNCNDDGPGSNSACAMAFAVSGSMTINAGGALYAENRSATGSGGAITLSVGGNLSLASTAIISSAAKTAASGDGGAITVSAGGGVALASGATIDSGSAKSQGGTIIIAAGGVTIDGNVLSGPSRTLLATRLTGAVLGGGNPNQSGGRIAITSTTFAEPAIAVGATGSVVSQGEKNGAGTVTLDGCGIEIRGLVAALSIKDSPARVVVRSGKSILVDGRDLGGAGSRMGRVRGEALNDAADNDGVDLFASNSVSVLGPASGSLFAVTSLPGAKANKDGGGTIRVIALGETAGASGRAFAAGVDSKGTRGGTISIEAAGDVDLDTASLVAAGDSSKPKKQSAGGHIAARSYAGDILWRNGSGDVRPIGSGANVPVGDQGTIVLTACGTVDITGSSYPTNGVPTSFFPDAQTGVCSPAAPSLPGGALPLITCNTPPVASDVTESTNEDNAVTVHLSGSDADSDPLTFSIVTPPAHGSLGPIVSTGPATAEVLYTPDMDFNGTDSFVFEANDGNGGTDDATATIIVASVNDPPVFLAGPTVTVLEDSGAQTYANWVTAISPGPLNESGQSVTFTVNNDNASLFSVQPGVGAGGTLTFTPAANAHGTANITVVAHDDGGTANGGIDTSASQMSSITVTPVNDEPSFLAGASQTVLEDAGPQSVSGWATSISAGPNESGQTLTFLTSNDNNALFSAQPGVSPGGTLTYAPAADANGSATVTVYLMDDGGTANGGDDTSPSQMFTITVTAVNDAPSFTGGPNVTVNEDSGAYSAPWATGASAGPANESGQILHFTIDANSDPSLFAAGPSVAPDGTLSFTPAADAFGSASITITLHDDGGFANGGADTSSSYSFIITVDPVNDAPLFAPGGDVTVNEDSGAYAAPWATAISAGPNEGTQTVNFIVSNDNNALFSAQPVLSPGGVLTFTPAPNANGSAIVSVTLHDDGGAANGGVDTSATAMFTLTVVSVNDPPVVAGESYETIGNTTLEVSASQALSPSVFVSGSVLANDSDIDGPNPLTATFVSASAGATVVVSPNGTFTYTPPAGFTGGTDSFVYGVSDGQDSVTGTVTITVKNRVWYVRNNGGGTSGRSNDPFSSLAAAESASSPGDTIYVFTGDGTTSGQSSGFVMKNSQRLLGAGVALTVPVSVNGGPNPTVLLATGTRPQTGNTGGSGVTALNVSGVEIAGLDVSASTSGVSVATTGTSSGSANIHDMGVVSAVAEGFNIDGGGATGILSVSVSDVSASSSGNAFDARTTAGELRLAIDDSSFSSPAAAGVFLSGGAGTTLVVTSLANDSVSGNTAGDGFVAANVRFDAVPGGSLDVVNGGTMTIGAAGNGVGGSGMRLTATDGHLSFGSLSIEADGTTGLFLSGNGPLTATTGTKLSAASGSITATAGPAITASNSTLGLALGNIVSANSPASGISLSSIGGSLSAAGGSITEAASSDVLISGSSANVSYGGSITDDTGTLVNISTSTGTMSFSGPITDGNDGDGNGIALTNNSGGTISFSGGLTLSTGASPAFSATGGGTLTVTGTNKVTTTTATAVNVANTTIGAAGVTFESIDSTTAGGSTVILLNTTGSGSFTVTGAGTADASGGTIANKTNVDAITLRNTGGLVTLRNMLIQDIGKSTDATDTSNTRSGVDAIHGESVGGGLTLDNTDIKRISDSGINGTAFSDPSAGTATTWNGLTITNCLIEDTNRFGVTNRGDATNEGAVHILGLKGVVTITGSTFQRAGQGLDIDTDTIGTLDMTVQSSSFLEINKEMPGQPVNRAGLFGIDVRQLGALASVIRIGDPAETNASLGNIFTNDALASIRIVSEVTSSGNLQAVIAKNQFSVTDHSSPGVPPGSFTFNFPQGGVNLRPRGTGRYEAIVAGNTLDQLMHADGGLGELSLIIEGGDSEFIVRNNVFQLPWDAPVELRADGASGMQSSAAVQFVNNQYVGGTVGSASDDLGGPSPSPFTPFYVQVRNGGHLNLTGQSEIFPQHDPSSGFAQSLVTRTTSAGDVLALFLQNCKSPAGYRLSQGGGTFNLYRNGSAGATAQQVLQDNGNTGGGGNDNTIPPSVTTTGTITLSNTVPVLPAISIP